MAQKIVQRHRTKTENSITHPPKRAQTANAVVSLSLSKTGSRPREKFCRRCTSRHGPIRSGPTQSHSKPAQPARIVDTRRSTCDVPSAIPSVAQLPRRRPAHEWNLSLVCDDCPVGGGQRRGATGASATERAWQRTANGATPLCAGGPHSAGPTTPLAQTLPHGRAAPALLQTVPVRRTMGTHAAAETPQSRRSFSAAGPAVARAPQHPPPAGP